MSSQVSLWRLASKNHLCRVRFHVLIVLVATLTSFSCKTAEFGFKVIDLHGMVYDFSNRPVAHYEISLGKRYKTVTDINGRFTLPKVPAGNYTLTGFKKGFENYAEEIDIRDRRQIIYFRIPSQNQLLDLVDDALASNNITLAGELAERAYSIDENNIEMLFYYATVNFRQGEYHRAIDFLEATKNLGSRDLFVERLLTIVRRQQNAENFN